MDKKPVGVKIISVILLLLSISFVWAIVTRITTGSIKHTFSFLWGIAILILFLFSSIGLFGLKEWARKLCIYLVPVHFIVKGIDGNLIAYAKFGQEAPSTFTLILSIGISILFIVVIPMFLLIYYLTRPKVKEMFR